MNKSLLSLLPRSRILLLRRQRYYGSITENKINQWLREKGDEGLSNKGKPLKSDRHKGLSHSLGVGHDYVHSKILADNNIKPESVERRIKLDAAWAKLKDTIRSRHRANPNQSIDEFVRNHKQEFADAMQELGILAKRVNEAIISDSLRFNGRSPVPHARPFPLEERIREALKDE